jgi:hypothetical protein
MEIIDLYPHLSINTLATLALEGADQEALDRLEAEAVRFVLLAEYSVKEELVAA